MKKLLLLGDEAIAQGAIDAGISGVYAYPGTPSTEITEYIQRSEEANKRQIRSKWSANEKTAMESALGMSYAGKKSLVCMKHVGLNVAADAFINSGITGANGGLVVLSADDPSMHSSQNEQDSRFYGKFTMIPTMEPSNQQEAYDMTRYAFDLSEKYETPVLIRVTTRLAHSRAGVQRVALRNQNKIKLPTDLKQFILLPAIARKRYDMLLGKQVAFKDDSSESGFNKLYVGEDKSLGIISCGISYNYLEENYKDDKIPYSILKIGQYPVPRNLLNKLYESVDEILVLEEGYPIIEELLRGMLNKGKKIKGRMDGTIPMAGELTPKKVAIALKLKVEKVHNTPDIVRGRPPKLCDGCSHTDTFTALNEAMNHFGPGRVFSDIGCYTLSALAPLESINSCVDMGASITMAIGAADAGLFPSVAAIGDSTFTHSGITGLLDAVNTKSPITVIINDNSTTGMTGGQDSSAFEKVEDICRGIGVEENHIRFLKPLRRYNEENIKIILEELNYIGVSVIISRRECVQTLGRRMKLKARQRSETIKTS
ncbi:MAG: indolepyruvate ferredoxin oxidoreductase subunit alpha [Lentimicrobiaceae bacterium]|jgi:indolepyruvate ferredoxin oxidoreductase alpha subunit|nr:indolepyruvate ferredoxin oxidoreductase subunit alpha [Lentimicrobiaceae bacterium]MBT3453401.1 indolepyruvate ferredoxin oxidoreductase subunit alpha [Lentimicrobiaceae bacterium]MBT3819035.1 indolepyruvate ferredoxin oxidoreductase subunit alpha [Lentimicrobiaceae bacterium]MBT4061983.1 indolepyruvate ferredoxin oxidoreductase subunit alpha [Lentimicrobiaceae bacterium]MBT4191568.1 indolepyruvate ferredoxin oxidoreductase subunit alpha [Lentimicrobiaceae bacterium]